MQFNIIELFFFFMVVAGPAKALSFFASAAAQLTMAQRRTAIIKAVVTQIFVLGAFAFFGSTILNFFHVSIGALEIAGGLILLIFALQLVLGEKHESPEGEASGDFAIYPLAMPLLATPQAIVAIVVVFARVPDMQAQINGYIALALIFILNLVALFALAKMMGEHKEGAEKGGAIAEVLLRVVAILLAALAIELMVLGLREYGIMEAASAIAH